MYDILYISNVPLHDKSGYGKLIDMHHQMLESIFGDRMYSFFFGSNEDNRKHHNEMSVHTSKSREKVIANILGLPPYLNPYGMNQLFDIFRTEKFQYVFIDNSISGSLISRFRKINPNVKVICFFHDVEADLMKKEIPQKRFMRKVSLWTMIQNERKTVAENATTIVLNNRDALCFKSFYKKMPDIIMPCIIPFPQIEGSIGRHHLCDKLNITFIGKDYWPNIQGLRWFIDTVIPQLSAGYNFRIVGFGLEKYKDEFERNHYIQVIGTVDDLTPYYIDADVIIAPISDGGGMKVKTAEAFSYGKVFVGLEESLVGYWEEIPENLKNKVIFKVTDEQDFAMVLNNLARSEFDKCNTPVIQWAKENYSQEANVKKLCSIFDNYSGEINENIRD